MPITIDVMKNEFLREIYEDGKQGGREEGVLLGEFTLLNRVLESRFGSLPEWAVEKIRAADKSTIELWALRLFHEDTLEGILR